MEFEFGFSVEYVGYVPVFLLEALPDFCGGTKGMDLD
jgi:hypothetical protein